MLEPAYSIHRNYMRIELHCALKTRHHTLVPIFTIYWLIFNILSLVDFLESLQWRHGERSHHTSANFPENVPVSVWQRHVQEFGIMTNGVHFFDTIKEDTRIFGRSHEGAWVWNKRWNIKFNRKVKVYDEYLCVLKMQECGSTIGICRFSRWHIKCLSRNVLLWLTCYHQSTFTNVSSSPTITSGQSAIACTVMWVSKSIEHTMLARSLTNRSWYVVNMSVCLQSFVISRHLE